MAGSTAAALCRSSAGSARSRTNVAADALTDADAISYLDWHAEAGCDKAILLPSSTELAEVDRLRDAVAEHLT